MQDKVKIAIDAMGGDNSPDKILDGIEISLKNNKENFFSKYLDLNKDQKNPNNMLLINYFNKYQAFCFDLSSNSVLKGDINFNYK